MNQFQIIKLSPDRWQEYRALRLKGLLSDAQAFGRTYELESKLPDERWLQRLRAAFDGKYELLYFAQSSGELIGMLGAFWEDSPKTEHVATVVGFYVDPVYRGVGVGKALMAKVLEELSWHPKIVKAKLFAVTTQTPAVALYQSFGFEPIGILKREIKVNDIFYDEFLMEKFLK